MRLCVFCGSSPGNGGQNLEGAPGLGRALTERGIGLVYGAASVGCMGVLAAAVLHSGGEVIGVIPRVLVEREIEHRRAGYYDGLAAFLDHALDAGFLNAAHRGMLVIESEPNTLLTRFAAYGTRDPPAPQR